MNRRRFFWAGVFGIFFFVLISAITCDTLAISNWPVIPNDIRISPIYEMSFEDKGKHPFLIGISESNTFSNFWGDPGLEWDKSGHRKAKPVTKPTSAGFLWSEYLDVLEMHGMNCVREMVLPWKLDDPAKFSHHYNPYPFPWIRRDSQSNYIPGYSEDSQAPADSPGYINFQYLHSEPVPDYSLPQEDYFKYRVARFCREAKARNIYVILTIFPINPYFPYEPGNENVKAYIDMLLKHTADIGNVLYEINWEGGNGRYFIWWAGYVSNSLKQAKRPQNVILVNHSLVRPHIDHKNKNSTIVGHHREHTRQSLLAAKSFSKPVIWTEDFDEGKTNAHTEQIADVVRDRTWQAFTAGAGHIWFDWSMRMGNYKDSTLFDAAKSLVKFIAAVDPSFWTMIPQDELVTNHPSCCLANSSGYCIIYFPQGTKDNINIDLQKSDLKARWYNPASERNGDFLGREFNVPPSGLFSTPCSATPADKLVLYIYPENASRQKPNADKDSYDTIP